MSLSKLSLKGTARLSLRPVWDRLPLFGALQVALVHPPEVGYELSLGPMLAALMPLVKTWLDGWVRCAALLWLAGCRWGRCWYRCCISSARCVDPGLVLLSLACRGNSTVREFGDGRSPLLTRRNTGVYLPG